jgi:hypothetical protein
MNATIDSHAFLVKIDSQRFLVGVDTSRGEVEITDVLSYAKHLDYRSADDMAVRLRRRGFRQSHVCDVLGQPVTSQMLSARPVIEPKAPLPRTLAELNKLSTNDARRRYKSEPEFATRVDQLYSAG